SGQSASTCEKGVRRFVRAYRMSLMTFATMRFATLGRYLITRRRGDPLLKDIFREAERVTPNRNLQKLTVHRGARFRFRGRKTLPLVSSRLAAEVLTALRAYAGTLVASRARTLARYHAIDVAFKIVGTGSMGTRDYVVLLFGNGDQDPVFLQVKQELASC